LYPCAYERSLDLLSNATVAFTRWRGPGAVQPQTQQPQSPATSVTWWGRTSTAPLSGMPKYDSIVRVRGRAPPSRNHSLHLCGPDYRYSRRPLGEDSRAHGRVCAAPMDASLSFGPSLSMDDDDCVLTAVSTPFVAPEADETAGRPVPTALCARHVLCGRSSTGWTRRVDAQCDSDQSDM